MVCICLTYRYPDTPCISQTLSVTFSDSHTQSVLDAVNSIGEVSMTGSLQIAELVEHPGAILVQWFDEVMFLCFHSWIQLAPYSFTIASTLKMNAHVICVLSKEMSLFFRCVRTSTWAQKAKLTVNFLKFPFLAKNGFKFYFRISQATKPVQSAKLSENLFKLNM